MTGTTSIGVKDKTGKGCSWCQTVLPGNEAMIIPTWVGGSGSATLAIPTTEYWDGTSAQYVLTLPLLSYSLLMRNIATISILQESALRKAAFGVPRTSQLETGLR